MLNDDKKKKTMPELNPKKEITPVINIFSPVCQFKKNTMSKAFEAALDAVKNMNKKNMH